MQFEPIELNCDWYLAGNFQTQFGFQAFRATASTSLLFATSAVGMDRTRPILVDEHPMNLARITISSTSLLADKKLIDVKEQYNVCIVFHHQEHLGSYFHPQPDNILSAGDVVVMLGGAKQIHFLTHG